MNRKDLAELIQTEIREALIGKAKQANSSTDKLQSSESYLQSEEITEDSFDEVLFYGLQKPNEDESVSRAFTIKESPDGNIKITPGEIKEFEASFKELLGSLPNATVVFNKQKNGYSILALKKPDGIEAVASGVINLGNDGKILWSYSIMNGLTINAQNLRLDNDSKMVTENIYNHFITWQKTWREKLNYPDVSDQPI